MAKPTATASAAEAYGTVAPVVPLIHRADDKANVVLHVEGGGFWAASDDEQTEATQRWDESAPFDKEITFNGEHTKEVFNLNKDLALGAVASVPCSLAVPAVPTSKMTFTIKDNWTVPTRKIGDAELVCQEGGMDPDGVAASPLPTGTSS
ncbi:hypothetical protein IAT40_004286 [Kwoniella sp. CBS 6097]